MKKFFIGIDFSKLKFDVAIYGSHRSRIIESNVFENNVLGFKHLLKWINSIVGKNKEEWLFCGEHTGLYSLNLSIFLRASEIDVWLESGLQIKLSQGIQREKTDKVDACHIAEYAFRHQDKVKLFEPKSKIIDGIKDLLMHRDRLVEAKKVFLISSKELRRYKTDNSAVDYIFEDSDYLINSFKSKIKACEEKINDLISEDSELHKNYKLLLSINGIGLVNAVMVLSITANFTLFTDARKFGCYCGVVPFKYDSGTSIKGRTKISHVANKKVKALLTQAARTSVMHDPEIKAYYERKRGEGKLDKIVINNIRNKIIHRMFAVVQSGIEFDVNYVHPLKQAA